MQKIMYVEGMMCAHCVKHVQDALTGMDGVSGAEVNLKKKCAVVTLEKDVSDEAFRAAIAEAGYEVKKIV